MSRETSYTSQPSIFESNDEEMLDVVEIQYLSDCNKYFTVDGLEVTNFVIVYSKDDIEQCHSSPHRFKPLFTHQIYGPQETVFGYRNLTVTLFYHHNSAKCLLDIKFSELVKESDKLGIKADNIYSSMAAWLPDSFSTNKFQFICQLSEENSSNMHGNLVEAFQLYGRIGETMPIYKITKCNLKNPEFRNFHERFESFIVWFIDSANKIDLYDDNWNVIYLYEEKVVDSKVIRSPIGFCSFYNFWVYPNYLRSRISQFFILPTHQRLGLGTKFYTAIYKFLIRQQNLIDITVEAPSPVFSYIRDKHDCWLTIDHDIVQPYVNVSLDMSHEIRGEMHHKLKLCKRQCERICHIFYFLKAKNFGGLKVATDYVKLRHYEYYSKRFFVPNYSGKARKKHKNLSEISRRESPSINKEAMEYIKNIKLVVDYFDKLIIRPDLPYYHED